MKNKYIDENNSAIGDTVMWVSRGKQKQGVIVAAIKTPKFFVGMNRELRMKRVEEFNEAIKIVAEKHEKECTINFICKSMPSNSFSPIRKEDISFIVKVPGKSKKQKSKLMRPYTKNLIKVETP